MHMTSTLMSRRALLLSGGAFLALAGSGLLSRFAGAETVAGKPGKVEIAIFSDAKVQTGVETLDKVVKTEEEWKKQLSPLAFEVTRQEGTERAFTGPFNDEKRDGIFRCVCCNTALYDSATKFDSGTGWPSFYQPIAKQNVAEHEDTSFFMVRTSIACALCDAHLGHVFPDGPDPTGLRYCMNGVALTFVPRATA
jgi:peptide-methionine (R)-S-oxide reductase